MILILNTDKIHPSSHIIINPEQEGFSQYGRIEISIIIHKSICENSQVRVVTEDKANKVISEKVSGVRNLSQASSKSTIGPFV